MNACAMTNDQLRPLIKMLTIDEGFKALAYDDATGKEVKAPVGNLTIGIGINLQNGGISYDEALYLLVNRIRKFEDCLSGLAFYASLDIVRRYVLINMAFNLGFAGLMEFKKMLDAINAKDYERAHAEILHSDAFRQLPARYGRLALMMQTGTM